MSYTFKAGALKNIMGISNFAVYLAGSNLFTITSLIEGDPESTNFQQGFYPQITTGRLGLKVNF